jgi:UDP-N-acetylglucosamine:LPS N-acetylglucosamine transferase
MSDVEAIPAGAVFETYKKLTDLPVIKQETTRQSKIATLASSDGFKAVQEMIDQWINDLRNIPIDPQKDTVESVGFRYMASKVTIEYLESIRNMPERYKEINKQNE